jgi:energy-coupling factor transporter ATP-binding protein EcfA2
VGDVLELRGLTRRYGDLVALDDLSFAVAEGQMFGFVGPNGAGKTTAMRIVLGVLEANAGQVFWRGSPIDEQTRKRTGYMPEDHGQTFPRQCAGSLRSWRVHAAPARGHPEARVTGFHDRWGSLGVVGRYGGAVFRRVAGIVHIHYRRRWRHRSWAPAGGQPGRSRLRGRDPSRPRTLRPQ